jgi:hypothetical protein
MDDAIRITFVLWTALDGVYVNVVVDDVVRCKNRVVDVLPGDDDTIENALATPMMRDVTKRVDIMTMIATFLEGPLPAADDRTKKGVLVVMGSETRYNHNASQKCAMPT